MPIAGKECGLEQPIYAKAKGGGLDARVTVDAARRAALRAQGHSWGAICRATGLSKGTAQRALSSLPKIPALPSR